jgi:hypothetical protein
MDNEAFYRLLTNLLSFLQSYNFNLLTNQSKSTGYFTAIKNNYACFYIPPHTEVGNFLTNVFPPKFDDYIAEHDTLLESQETYLILSIRDRLLNVDIGHYVADKNKALDILSRNKYYYAVLDTDGNVIKNYGTLLD